MEREWEVEGVPVMRRLAENHNSKHQSAVQLKSEMDLLRRKNEERKGIFKFKEFYYIYFFNQNDYQIVWVTSLTFLGLNANFSKYMISFL